jgi:hypothetical protein
MSMKKIILFLLVLIFLDVSLHAGCGLSVKVSIGLNYPVKIEVYDTTTTFTVNPIYALNLKAYGGACSAFLGEIYRNDTLVPLDSYITCKPGRYRVTASSYYVGGGTFIFKIFNDLGVGIDESDRLNKSLAITPNPAVENVTINLPDEYLKYISISSSSGASIGKYNVEGSTITVPLNNLPRGIYFVQVATVTNKIAIKKLVVQ